MLLGTTHTRAHGEASMTQAHRSASCALQADLCTYSISKTTSVSWAYQPPLIFIHKNTGMWNN